MLNNIYNSVSMHVKLWHLVSRNSWLSLYECTLDIIILETPLIQQMRKPLN